MEKQHGHKVMAARFGDLSKRINTNGVPVALRRGFKGYWETPRAATGNVGRSVNPELEACSAANRRALLTSSTSRHASRAKLRSGWARRHDNDGNASRMDREVSIVDGRHEEENDYGLA